MANEFVARKGLISSGSVEVSGSVTASAFKGDGSQLTNINSSSYSQTASFANKIFGGALRYVPLFTGSTANELTSSIIYQTTKGIFVGYDTAPHFHSAEGETLAVHSGETGVKNVIYAHGASNDSYRVNIRNISPGISASTNFIATTDNGNDLGGYVRLGINSSTYTRTDELGGPLDAYLFSTGSDLLIGTLSPDKRIILFTGPGNAANNARVYIDASGSVAINTANVDAINPEALLVTAIAESYNLITGKANLNNYSQLNITNLSGGSSASADVVATANNGTETSNYIDMGINSDQYGLIGAVGGPNDAYIYSTGNMLHIGNASENQHVMFFAGGIDAEANNKLTLDANNQHSLSGSLNVTGSINVLEGVVNNLTASYAESASYAPPRFIDNFITVGLPGSNTQYNSIKAAVDSITDASAANTYTVKVYPGVYIEDTINLKSYIAVKGESSTSTIVSASNPNNTIFVMADQTMVIDMGIQGSTGPAASAVVYSSPTTPQTNAIAYVENVRFGTNYTNAKVVGSGSSGNCILQCSNVKYGGFTSGSKSFDVGFYVTSGSDGGIGRMQLRNVTSTNGGVAGTDDNQIFALADAPGCTFIVNGCLLTRATGVARGTGFKVYNGGQLRLTGVNFQRWIRGIWAPQTGSAPSIDAIALNFENCTTDVAIEHSGSLGKVQGTDNFLKTQINFSSSLYEVGKDARRIRVAKKGGDFTSISASVAYITDSNVNNRYVIEVGPGQYTEKTIDLTGKPYVSIVGSNIQTTQIFPSSSTQHIIKMGVNNEISFLSLANAGPGYAAIYVDDVGDFAQAHKISIYDSDIGIKVLSRTQDTQFYGEYIDINGTFSYGTYVSASNNATCLTNLENYYLFPLGVAAIGNYVTHPSASLSLNVATFQGDNTANSVAIKIDDGSEVEGSSLDIQDWDYGIQIPNVGDGPNFRLVGCMIHGSSTYDMEILNAATRGRFQGVSDHSLINNISENVYWNFLDDTDGENDVTRKLSVTFADGTHTDATTLIFKGSPMGVMQGGVITTGSGLNITVASGFGYVEDSINADVYKRLDWSSGSLTLIANSNNYVYLNSTGTLTTASTIPNNEQNIILGRVVTNDTTSEFIDQTPYNGSHMANKLSTFNREALGPVFSVGSTVTENVTPFKLDITQGTYFFSENKFTPSGTSSANLTQFYPSASTWARYTSPVVPNNQYVSASVLTSMTAGYYTKHTLYLVGDGVDEKYFLVLNSNEYSTLVEAENADLPTIPEYFNDGVVALAAIYINDGAENITQIQDIRPIIGFRSAGVSAASVHSNLLGLDADDHVQYLLVNGTRAMAGNLSLGGYNINNIGSVSASSYTSSLNNQVGFLGTSSWAVNANTASFATTSSAATSITFTPTTASFAATASAATSITFTPTSASFSTTSSYILPSGLPSGSVSSSAQINYTQIQNKPTTIETASYVEFVNVVNRPELVSSSQQINTGSFTGSFTGNILGNAVSASVLYVNGNITQPSQSSHTASLNYLEIPATSAKVALSTRGKILYSNFFSNTSSLPDANLYHGMFTHVHSEGAAYYSHGSNGWVRLWDQFNVPVLISSSGQFTNLTAPFTGSFTGSFTGNGSGLTNVIPNDTVSSSAQITGSISGSTISPAIITGSNVRANKLTSNTWLELYPTTEAVTPDPESAYFYISGSNNNLWYSHKQDSTVNFDWIEGTLETGLLHGGIAGFSGSNVYIRSGSGIIVTHGATTGSAPSPTINYVQWPAQTSSIDVNNGFVTYLAINAQGLVTSQSTKFTPSQYNDAIPLGAVGHFNNIAIVAKGDQVNTQYSAIGQLTDFTRNFGPIKVGGYGITAQSGSLKFSRAAGDAFIYGGFYSQNPETPSNFQSSAVSTGSLAYVYRTGSVQGYAIDANNNNFYTDIKPGFYDVGGSTGTASLASNEWSIQRVFVEPVTGIHYIYYGQTKYTSLANALANLTTDTFAEGPATTLFTVFIGYIIAKGDTTNLLNTAENSVVNAGLFRNTSAGSVGGGAAAQLLGDLSDVSITSPSNGQALIYSSGNWINGVPSNAVSASFATTSSFATSASYAPASPVSWNDVTSKPALISSSLQFTNLTEPFTGSFTGSFTGNGSGVTGVISASYASNTSNTGRKIVNSIPFIVGERLELQNIGATVDEIDTGLRVEVNLSTVDFIQVSARVERGTGADSELRVQYSTDENTWSNLTTVTGVNAGARVDLLTAGTILTSELAIASGAKTNVILRLVTTSGTGLSAQLGNVVLHTIYQL